MSTIKFRLAAKTDMGLVRTNNEDNFQAAADLSSGQMRWVNNEICSLGEKGALLVVADGMGGMNAGEVASELAIETVREYFSLENLTPEVTKNRFSIEKYMKEVIVAADARIKAEAKERPETRGMGTTIVIGWILEGQLYVSWCGDSRAYIYNPVAGLHQITKDHSYVQGLVDKGVISREDAFEYPDSNIITRSLCDGGAKAKPESLLKPYELCDNDIVLLCTDGLCGMVRDNEMELVIRNNEHNMDVLVDELIHAACEAEGSDNITVCLCQILQGGGHCNPDVFIESENRLNGGINNMIHTVVNGNKAGAHKGKKKITALLICLLLVMMIIGGGIWYFVGGASGKNATDVVKTDSTDVKKDSIPDTLKQKDDAGDNDKVSDSSGKGNKAESLPDHGSGKSIFPNDTNPGKDKVEEMEPGEEINGEKDVLVPVGNINEDEGDAPEVKEQKTIPDEYLIKKGEFTWKKITDGINKEYKTDFSEIEVKNANPKVDLGTIKIGQKIKIPKK